MNLFVLSDISEVYNKRTKEEAWSDGAVFVVFFYYSQRGNNYRPTAVFR